MPRWMPCLGAIVVERHDVERASSLRGQPREAVGDRVPNRRRDLGGPPFGQQPDRFGDEQQGAAAALVQLFEDHVDRSLCDSGERSRECRSGRRPQRQLPGDRPCPTSATNHDRFARHDVGVVVGQDHPDPREQKLAAERRQQSQRPVVGSMQRTQ